MKKEGNDLENGMMHGERAYEARQAEKAQERGQGKRRIDGVDVSCLSPEMVLDVLNEPPRDEAYMCDFSVFQMLYRREKAACVGASLEDMPHLAVFSAEIKQSDTPLNMVGESVEQLGKVLRKGLRKTDVVSRCSFSQYIIMLRRITVWNGVRVCRRLENAFQEACPDAAVTVAGELLV